MQPLADFRTTRFVVPIRRRIGGHDCVLDTIWLAALELRDAAQRTGLGFAASLRSPLPPLAALTDHFARQAWPLAWAASARGIPVTLGNTVMNIGAHLAAALPNVDLVEDSQLPWTELVARPIPVMAGEFHLGEDPGHGLTLSPQAHLFADPGGE